MIYPVVNYLTKEIKVFASKEDAQDFVVYLAAGPGWEHAQPCRIMAVEYDHQNWHVLTCAEE